MYLYAAECFPYRTEVQCLHRWQKVLNPELIKGPWTQEVCHVADFALMVSVDIISSNCYINAMFSAGR
jgi:hypothetical protein